MKPATRARVLRDATPVLAGALGVAVAAQVSVPVPGSAVPQSLQTLAVVVVGALLGWRGGGAALVLYVLLGGVGLPVFADGASGLERLWGPTGGYLAGFVVAAGVAGWWSSRGEGKRGHRVRVVLHLAAGFLVAHAVILALGWGRLSLLLGPAEGWTQGVAPFLWGGVVKSLAAALMVWGWRALTPPR